MFVQLQKDMLGQKAGDRIDLADSDAQELCKQGLATVVPEDVLTPVINRAFDKAFNNMKQSLDKAVDHSLQAYAQAQQHARKNSLPAIFGQNAGDPERSFGDFLLAVRRGDQKQLAEKYHAVPSSWGNAIEQKAALSAAIGAQGGYTVPTEFLPQLLKAAAEKSVVRSRATIIPMSSRAMQIPVLDVTATPTAGDSAYFGGLVARWTEEAAAITETEPTFKQIELVAHELSGHSKISNQLFQDSAIGLEALLIRLFGDAIAWFEDYAYLRGDGVAKPLGVVGGAATWAKSVTRASANSFTLVDAAKMVGSLLPGWNPNTTCWVMHPSAIQQCFQMTSSAAGVGFLSPNLSEAPRMQLLGFPIEVSEKLPALGTAKDVLLVDFSHYVIGDRQQIEIAYSEHVAFLSNQSVWRFVSRVDGQPWLRSVVTLADASSSVSPYVYLN